MTSRAIFTVTAGSDAMCSATSRTVAPGASSATTRLTTPCVSASGAVSTRLVRTRSLTSPAPAISNRAPTPPVSGMTPYVSSGRRKRAPSAAMRKSHSNARWNAAPITHPLHATITGASRSQSCWMPRWPRRISSWCESGTWWEPIALTSRPDENDFPSPRQMIARISGRVRSSSRISKRSASISSSNALCLSGLSFVMVAIAPSSSSRTGSVTDRNPRQTRCEVPERRRRESNPRTRFCRPLPVPLGYAAGTVEITGSPSAGRGNAERGGREDERLERPGDGQGEDLRVHRRHRHRRLHRARPGRGDICLPGRLIVLRGTRTSGRRDRDDRRRAHRADLRRRDAPDPRQRHLRRRPEPHVAHHDLLPGPGEGGGAVVPDASPDRKHGTYPLILYSHGHSSFGAEFEALLRQWASAGYVVAAPD